MIFGTSMLCPTRIGSLTDRDVVVVGMDLNGLGVVRALSQAAISVVVLDTVFAKPTAMTWFGRKVRVRALSGPCFVEDLLQLRTHLKHNPVLILTQESTVTTVSAARALLAHAYQFSFPSTTVMQSLMDKMAFQVLAEELGYRIPRGLILTDATLNGLEELRYPCVVKPVQKHHEFTKRFGKAYKVNSAEDVQSCWLEMRQVIDEAIIQEWIEGPDLDVCFCLQYRPPSGRGSVSFVGRKTCQWPPLVGGTASCIPAPEFARELTAVTDRFFAAVGCVGLCSMEYKRDSRDNLFYMVEPTVGRTDYQEEVAALNGVNIPLAACYGELGLPVPARSSSSRLHAWRDPVGTANARRAGAADPLRQLAPGAKIWDAYFRLSDPLPYMALKAQALRTRYSRSARKTLPT
jgi:D-aspartate ligase